MSDENTEKVDGGKAGKQAEAKPQTEQKEDEKLNAFREVIAETAREDERPQSRNMTLSKILGGDLLSASALRHNIWLIVIIVVFLIVYTANRYSCQRYLIKIDKLNQELKDAKYKAMAANSQITEICRESKVLEQLQNNKDSVLKMPSQPPYIIQVPEEK